MHSKSLLKTELMSTQWITQKSKNQGHFKSPNCFIHCRSCITWSHISIKSIKSAKALNLTLPGMSGKHINNVTVQPFSLGPAETVYNSKSTLICIGSSKINQCTGCLTSFAGFPFSHDQVAAWLAAVKYLSRLLALLFMNELRCTEAWTLVAVCGVLKHNV